MKPLQKAAAAAVLALTALPVIAQPPAFDPRSWRGQHIGQPTQVLTIGSAHLSELKVPLTAAMFTPLLDRLARFNPQIITVEGISGEQCDTLRRYAVRTQKASIRIAALLTRHSTQPGWISPPLPAKFSAC